jgi:hypothetical protein
MFLQGRSLAATSLVLELVDIACLLNPNSSSRRSAEKALPHVAAVAPQIALSELGHSA